MRDHSRNLQGAEGKALARAVHGFRSCRGEGVRRWRRRGSSTRAARSANLTSVQVHSCRHPVSSYAVNAPMTDHEPQPAYAIGQYVELYPTIRSSSGRVVESGTRAIVRGIDLSKPNDDIYLVEFLWSERATGELAWLRTI